MTNPSLGVRCAPVGFVAVLLLLSGCGDSKVDELQIPAPPAPVQSITRVSDSATLESYLKAGLRAQTQTLSLGGDLLTVGPGGSSALAVSGTNLQEVGVDEADRIKTDGQWLYVLSHPYECCTESAPVLRIMRLASEPSASATEQARLSLGTHVGGDGLYLFSADAGGALDRLAVVGNRDVAMPYWFMPWNWQNRGLDVTIVDVSDASRPAVGTRLHIDGQLVSSRRVGDMLYLVSRYVPSVPGFVAYPATDDQRRRNEQILQSTPLTGLLPNWQVDGNDRGNLFRAEDCYLLPVSQEDYSPDMVTVTAIDLHSPATAPQSTCLLGPSEALYASPEALYLATTRYHYSPTITAAYPAEISTDVHQFALTPAGPALRGSATIPGHLGWHQDKKSFRLGEHEGVLRVVTSSGSWGAEQVRLTTLAEQNGKLVELAHIPSEQRPANIGKPGEQVYAVRFLGDRGFVVTFRTVDPLYVLDLSNPADPFIAGELQITGYSDYLHPVSDTRLLGIGKDAVPVDGEGDGRWAWYQGVKISLFDISDIAVPREIDSRVIGKRGTEAGPLYDHHALAWLPADPATSRPARLALPVELHETPGAYASTEPWSRYDWTHRGLYLFDIDPAAGAGAITPRGAMVIANRDNASSSGSWVSSDRAVIAGDHVHFVHDDKVWSATWGDVSSLSPAQ